MPEPGEGMPPKVLEITRKTLTTEAVLAKVIENLKLADMTAEEIEEGFPRILQAMMDEGLRILRKDQRVALQAIMTLADETAKTDEDEAAEVMWKGIQSLVNQSRKRAGVHMEKCMKYLLDRLDIPNQEGKPVTGRSDLICPSIEVFESHPERAVVLEFKRTIRERWKEVRDEISRSGKTVWLITLDDYLNDELVKTIAAGNITLYVPQHVFEKLKPLKGKLRSLDTVVEELRHVAGKNPQTKLAPAKKAEPPAEKPVPKKNGKKGGK